VQNAELSHAHRLIVDAAGAAAYAFVTMQALAASMP
jgi:hypothetical protein